MNSSYTSYSSCARELAAIKPGMTPVEFTMLCVSLTCETIACPRQAVLCVTMGNLYPGMVIAGDLLMYNGILPFTNLSEAINQISIGLTPNDIGLANLPDGRVGFGMTLHALKHCAERYSAIIPVMHEAELVIDALDLYKFLQR